MQPASATLATLSALAMLAAAVSVAAAGDDRWPPAAVRKAMVGCWEAGPDPDRRIGVTLHLASFGRHSVDAQIAVRPVGRTARRGVHSLARWDPATGALEVRCRAPDGPVCRIAPAPDRRLRVQVLARPAASAAAPEQVEDFIAVRCRRYR